MSQQYDNTNRGAIFKNKRKETDSHPDYTGSINFNGLDCWLSAWIKTGKNGEKFMSLSVKPKDEQRAAPQRNRVAGSSDADLSDDIPF